MLAALGIANYPLAISSNGRYHPQFALFISELAARSSRAAGTSRVVAKQRLVQSLSVTLQRANGTMLIKADSELRFSADAAGGDGRARRADTRARPWRGRQADDAREPPSRRARRDDGGERSGRVGGMRWRGWTRAAAPAEPRGADPSRGEGDATFTAALPGSGAAPGVVPPASDMPHASAGGGGGAAPAAPDARSPMRPPGSAGADAASTSAGASAAAAAGASEQAGAGGGAGAQAAALAGNVAGGGDGGAPQ